MSTIPLILQLNVAGQPLQWITFEDYAYYHAKEIIAWEIGSDFRTIYGGTSRMTGEQSKMGLSSIVAIKGNMSKGACRKQNLPPALTNRALFRRDRNTCAYCGHSYGSKNLTRDHIKPSSRGGPNVWTNVVACCAPCNKHKDNKTPKEAGMQLLFLPYVPSKAEYLILMNRNILADQLEFLLKAVSKESRLIN